MDTHTSVASTSAPLLATAGSSSTLAEPPVRAAIACAAARIAGSGWYPAGDATRTCIPAVAQPSR